MAALATSAILILVRPLPFPHPFLSLAPPSSPPTKHPPSHSLQFHPQIRSIFRCVEFGKTTLNFSAGGSKAYVRSEAVIYVLEAVPILASCVVFNVVHPAWYGLPNRKGERNGEGGVGLGGEKREEGVEGRAV